MSLKIKPTEAVLITAIIVGGGWAAYTLTNNKSASCPAPLKEHFVQAMADTNEALPSGKKISKAVIQVQMNDGHACTFSAP